MSLTSTVSSSAAFTATWPRPMTTTHGALQRAPLLTPGEHGLVEFGFLHGPRSVERALARAEMLTLTNETLTAIQAHRQETTAVKWANDIDRRYVQPLEGRLFPVPVRVPVEVGRTAPRSPFAAPPRERPFWRIGTALLVIASAMLVIAGTDLLRAAWQMWGGAR